MARPFFVRAIGSAFRNNSADNRPHRKPNVISAKIGRVETRDFAIEIKRVGQAQTIAKQPGECVKINLIIGNDEGGKATISTDANPIADIF